MKFGFRDQTSAVSHTGRELWQWSWLQQKLIRQWGVWAYAAMCIPIKNRFLWRWVSFNLLLAGEGVHMYTLLLSMRIVCVCVSSHHGSCRVMLAHVSSQPFGSNQRGPWRKRQCSMIRTAAPSLPSLLST